MTKNQITGQAGVHHVAALLSEEGFIVSLTPKNTERYDIFACAPNGRLVKLSVKTSLRKDWILGEKDEIGAQPDFYYALVKLQYAGKEPGIWILPSQRVNELCFKSHDEWKTIPGRDGKKHGHSSIRVIFQIPPKWMTVYPKDWEKEFKKYEGRAGIEQLGSDTKI